MFQLVLAAIDGSPASFRAATLGSVVAAAENGAMEVVAVAPPRTDLAGRLGFGASAAATEYERRQADVRSACAVIGTTVSIRSAEVVEGPVVESILGRCTDGDPGERLICVGSGKHRIRLGSVSGAVLRQADCSVLVVREGTSRGPRLQRLLVAYDGTPGAERAVEVAADIAGRAGAEVQIAWALRPSFPMPAQGLSLSRAEVEELAGEPERREMERAADRIRAAGGEIQALTFELGNAADRLLALAEESDVDLLVVGARGRSPVRKVLGGVSDRVAARSTRPVLVAK